VLFFSFRSKREKMCQEMADLKGQSHEIDLALIDIARRSRTEKWLEVDFKFLPCCTVFSI